MRNPKALELATNFISRTPGVGEKTSLDPTYTSEIGRGVREPRLISFEK